MAIHQATSGGSLLVEATPHSHGISGQAAVGERLYGPYDDEADIQKTLSDIEESLPTGNKMRIVEIGGKQRSWEITGEPRRVVPRPGQMAAH